jgi:hypothetical protein
MVPATFIIIPLLTPCSPRQERMPQIGSRTGSVWALAVRLLHPASFATHPAPQVAIGVRRYRHSARLVPAVMDYPFGHAVHGANGATD